MMPICYNAGRKAGERMPEQEVKQIDYTYMLYELLKEKLQEDNPSREEYENRIKVIIDILCL